VWESDDKKGILGKFYKAGEPLWGLMIF
jgi:hypothetical protein